MLNVVERGEEPSARDGVLSVQLEESAPTTVSATSWPSSGWQSLDGVSASALELAIFTPSVVECFLARRSSDGQPQGDRRDLGDEAFALYKRCYAADLTPLSIGFF